MFVHAVYFWLRDDLTSAEKAQFVDGIRSLRAIETVQQGYIGVPAGTNRPIIDQSYSYALILAFADRRAHDVYQEHPVHDAFRDECSSLWQKVLIYDSLTNDGAS
jgi:hypothetical protein